MNNDNQIEELKKLHYEIFHLIDKKDWSKLNKRMKEIRYRHDVNRSKMVLVATQSFVNQPEIMEERYLLIEFLIGDDDPEEHSQVAPYPAGICVKIENNKQWKRNTR